MVGTRFYKNDFDAEGYTQAADWCNKYGHTIVDQGDYYEVVEIVIPLSDLKEQKIAELKSIRDTKETEPILFNGHDFDFDQRSYERITAAIYALDLSGGSINWTTADNDTVAMTASDLRGVIAAAAVRSNALHIQYRELRALVDEANSKQDLDNIVWG